MTKRERIYHKRKRQHRREMLDWDIPMKRSPNDRICEDEGCSHRAVVKCLLDYQDEVTGEWEEQVEWLCCDHANESGYCMGCGTFIAGTGMEYRNHGYCDNCWYEIKSTERDEEDDFDDGSFEY